MSQKIDVTVPLIPATVTTLVTDIAAIQAIATTIDIALTESQETGLITVSTNKEALISAVFAGVMEPFPSTMSSDVTVAQFSAMTQEDLDTNRLIGLLTPILTILIKHGAILRNNRMFITTETLDNAKLAAKKNTALNTAVKLIVATYYTRKAAKPTASYEIPISSKMDLGGVKTGKALVNTGDASFSYVKTTGDIPQTIIVYPGSASKVPKGWTNITIINLSATSIAKFNVFMK
jgi:hypothetical protein